MADLMRTKDIIDEIKKHKEATTGEGKFGPLSPHADGYRMAHDHIMELILRCIPTVDAVEVVRCKDCESWGKPDKCGNGACKMLGCFMRANDFCSYAERKDNGNA